MAAIPPLGAGCVPRALGRWRRSLRGTTGAGGSLEWVEAVPGVGIELIVSRPPPDDICRRDDLRAPPAGGDSAFVVGHVAAPPLEPPG
jgi:hypothetical protein